MMRKKKDWIAKLERRTRIRKLKEKAKRIINPSIIGMWIQSKKK